MSVTETDRLHTMNPRGLSHAGWGLEFFQRSDHHKTGKTGSFRRFPTACPPCARKGVFYMSKLIDILFQTRVKYVAAKSSPPVCTAHTSLRAWCTQRRSCGTTSCGPWGRPRIWIASCTVNSCLSPLFEFKQVTALLRLQLLQSLALVVVAGEGDIEPGVVGIVGKGGQNKFCRET